MKNVWEKSYHSNGNKTGNKIGLISTLTSSFLGNQFDSLYYRAVLNFKGKSLDVIIKLPEENLHEISQWKNNIFKAFNLWDIL